MDDEKVNVPYIAFEGVLARAERTQRRLVIIIIITLAALFASNLAWILTLYGTDYESYEYQQDGTGINIIGDENKEVTNYGTETTGEEDNAQNRGAGQDSQETGSCG